MPLAYKELRNLAAAKLAQEKPGQTLQATALVHDAYLRLVNIEKARHWNGRSHFFGAAAEAMWRNQSLKEGGQFQRREAEFDRLSQPETVSEVLAVDKSLGKLARKRPLVAKLVELRFFAVPTLEDAASASGISVRTAHHCWTYAKAWLHSESSKTYLLGLLTDNPMLAIATSFSTLGLGRRSQPRKK